MGLVVSFVPKPASPHTRPSVAGQAASVIIFPGVRYERDAGEAERESRLEVAGPGVADPNLPHKH